MLTLFPCGLVQQVRALLTREPAKCVDVPTVPAAGSQPDRKLRTMQVAEYLA